LFQRGPANLGSLVYLQSNGTAGIDSAPQRKSPGHRRVWLGLKVNASAPLGASIFQANSFAQVNRPNGNQQTVATLRGRNATNITDKAALIALLYLQYRSIT
jgi:hypothetical protein